MQFTEICGAAFFAMAVIHTFCVGIFQRHSHRFDDGSFARGVFHLLGEVELVFALWAVLLALVLFARLGPGATLEALKGADFTEPAFVFAIMTVAATRPVLALAARAIEAVARVIPAREAVLPHDARFLIAAMSAGPLLGSFITEPAAMTVTALLLRERFFDRKLPTWLLYLGIGTLFVNVSIGGVLTPYAAPPVLMVAEKWGWGVGTMLTLFGRRALVAVLINALSLGFLSARHLQGRATVAEAPRSPVWLTLAHAAFLVVLVLNAHHAERFLAALAVFFLLVRLTRAHQDRLKIRASALVALFLAGLVVLGQFQAWWLGPMIRSLDSVALFFGATALTAIVDNAALTYLGSQTSGVTPAFQYALVAGAVAGGGLTVIANAPNPAGYSLLSSSFGEDGIKPLDLFLGALLPTVVAMACLIPLW